MNSILREKRESGEPSTKIRYWFVSMVHVYYGKVGGPTQVVLKNKNKSGHLAYSPNPERFSPVC